ncbi:MAG TPA: fatty acid desaturase [Pilimelia sp.]|nr:fatty acid desaturase [Pilimelia sp.]
MTGTTSAVLSTAAPSPPYRRGFANAAELREVVAAAHRTALWRTAGTAAVDQLSVPVLALAIGVWALPALPVWAALLVGALAVAAIGRQLRALECLVHEASHFNWSRRRRGLNDALAFALAALPTGARIADYRESHLRHHGRFGTADDPDRQRYEELRLEELDRSSLRAFTAGLARRFGAYQRGWLASLGAAPAVTALPLAWAAVMVGVPGWLLGGPAGASGALAVWLLGHALALPVIRFVGESSEHVYRGTETVVDATISNLGLVQRLVFHPHGDGYHTVHHLWPGVPHHRIAALHRALLRRDHGYASGLRYRTRVLAPPVRGAAGLG